MLTSLENANTNINVHYMTKNLVRSFVLVVGSPRHPTTTITTTVADRAQLPALRENNRKRHMSSGRCTHRKRVAADDTLEAVVVS